MMGRAQPVDTASAQSGVERTDEQLLQQVAKGDADALATLYDRFRKSAYSLALRILGDQGAAEDVVQESFLGIWRNAGRYSTVRASARTWILSIVHHRAVDALRRRQPATDLPDSDAPPPLSLVMPDVWPEVAGRLDREQVRRALGRLSPPQREAIELAYYGGLTQQQIAAQTGAPLGTVKSRVRLGLLALRHALISEARAAARLAPVTPLPERA